MQAWIAKELESTNLGDARLNRRYALVLDRLSQRPTLNIPAACEGWAETQATYRLFDNDKVSPGKLLAPHRESTLKRIGDQPVVLVVQDTTELDLTRKQEKVGGPLQDEDHYGLHAHVVKAFTPERIPLGVLDAEIWARDPDDFHKRSERRYKPIEEKESHRWLKGYQQACEAARRHPQTQVICVSDSEGDIYECFAEAAGSQKADWIVRACQDRCLADPEGKKVYSAVAETKVIERFTVQVSAHEAKSGDGRRRRKARAAREAEVTLRTRRVTLKAPWRPKQEKLSHVNVTAVLVREENPPEGEEPIEWLLLTSLPIDTVEQVLQIVEYYASRWEIEIFFRVLKSGCQVEQLQLETTDRVSACLAIYLVVAWRVMFVLMMGRKTPDLPCEAVFSPDEWRAVYTILRREPPPDEAPSLGEMVPLIASLGGYLGRKHDGPPGPKAMWIGIQRMRDFAIAWSAFGPDPQRPICV